MRISFPAKISLKTFHIKKAIHAALKSHYEIVESYATEFDDSSNQKDVSLRILLWKSMLGKILKFIEKLENSLFVDSEPSKRHNTLKQTRIRNKTR